MGKNRTPYFRPRQKPRIKTDQDIARQLEGMTPAQLAEGINNILRALEKKGIRITDYDDRKNDGSRRTLYKIQQVQGKLYYLAD